MSTSESTKPDDSLIQQTDAPVSINLFQQTDAPVNIIEEEAAYEDEAINNVTTFFPLKNTRDVNKFVEFLETDPENIRAFVSILLRILKKKNKKKQTAPML